MKTRTLSCTEWFIPYVLSVGWFQIVQTKYLLCYFPPIVCDTEAEEGRSEGTDDDNEKDKSSVPDLEKYTIAIRFRAKGSWLNAPFEI